jgi:2-polyprenyl-3-methyl-5-hydroxy-6-metoxy-1,4-benzoquinol methylase
VIELGCGIGACGSLAAAFADFVMLTDGEQETVELASFNASNQNNVSPDKIEVRELWWGDDSQLSEVLSGGAFDVILGAELFYYKTPIVELVETIDRLLAPNGVVYLSHLNRSPGLEDTLVSLGRERNLRVFFVKISHLEKRYAAAAPAAPLVDLGSSGGDANIIDFSEFEFEACIQNLSFVVLIRLPEVDAVLSKFPTLASILSRAQATPIDSEDDSDSDSY